MTKGENRAAIFDMDGVLMDNNPWHIEAWIAFAARYGKIMNREEVVASFGNTNKDYLRKLFGKEFTKSEYEALAFEKESIYREMVLPHLRPLAGLLALLDSLKNANYKIGIATGGPLENVDFVLSRLGISQFFQLVVHDALLKKGKPDPECYLLAARLLHVNPADCIGFEDSKNGILAARAAGMYVVGINTGGRADLLSDAQLVVDDFSTLSVAQLSDLFNKGL